MMIPKKKWCKTKNVSKKYLKAKADRLMSRYIRLRDEGKRCITCGRYVDYKNSDAGHYVNRKHMAVRYNPQNVHKQCRNCNRFDEGRSYEHGLAIDKMYGEGMANKLSEIGRCRGKYPKEWFESIISWLKKEISILEDAQKCSK